MTSIGDDAFYGCSSLTSITLKSTTPPTLSSGAIPTTIEKIIVPKSAINAYKSAANWSEYADKIVYEVDSSDIDKVITDLDVDNIAYLNKRNTFTQQMYIRNNNPYLTLGPNSQDEGNLGKDSLTFDYASGTKEVVTIYNRDYLYHYYYDSSTGEDIEVTLRFPIKSGTLALIEDLTAKLDKPTVTDSNYKIVTYNGTNSGTLDYSNAPNASSIMQRDADGRAQVVSGVSGNDIVNYSQLETKYDKTGGTIGGNVVITGDLTVNGTQHINNTENLNVENAMIYSNATGATLATNGGIGIKKNATDVYGIVYDPTSDSVKLGIGKSDANGRFTFNANEGNPVAVRDDSSKFTNNNLVKWDSTNHKFVDSGKKIDDLSTATNLENGTGLYSLVQRYIKNDIDHSSIATGIGSVAFGGLRFDYDPTKHSGDTTNTAAGGQSFVAGCGNYAAGDWSFVTGKDNTVYSNRAFISGGANISQAIDDEGNFIKEKTNAGRFNAIFGNNNTFKSSNTLKESNLIAGGSNTVDTERSIVVGYNNNVTGSFDAIFGSTNVISADYSLTGGRNHVVSGGSHLVAGSGNEVSGQYNIASGQDNQNLGWNSAVIGRELIVGKNHTSQIILGQYNDNKSDTVLEIGWGNPDNRKNVFEVLQDGRAKVQTAPTENNDVLRYQDTAVEVETSLMGA